MNTKSTSDSEWMDIQKEHYALLFSVRMSIRYHRKREQFLDRVNRGRLFVTVVAALGSITTTVGTWWPEGVTILMAAAGLGVALELAYGLGKGARKYNQLAARYTQLEKKLIEMGGKMNEDDLRKNIGERLEIEADEPPILTVLAVICHNEVLRATGLQAEQVPIGRLQRWAAHLFDVKAHELKREAQNEKGTDGSRIATQV